jgi:hypothetical protein
VFPRMRRWIQDAILEERYVVTDHARDELDKDDLTPYDVEACILNGVVVARQWDTQYREWKWLVHGTSTSGERCAVAVKRSSRGEAVILTVFLR